MIEPYDFDPPACFSEHVRRAAKDHPCGECRDGIRKGEHYMEETGVWDGRPGRYRTCARCYWDRARTEGPYWLYGGLYEELTNEGLERSPITYRSET